MQILIFVISRLYFVLQYLEGGTLSHYLSRIENQRLHEPLAQFYAAELYLGLEYLHNNGVIYRDLKPSNILLDEQGIWLSGEVGSHTFLYM